MGGSREHHPAKYFTALALEMAAKYPKISAIFERLANSGDSDERDHSNPAQADHPFRAKLTT